MPPDCLYLLFESDRFDDQWKSCARVVEVLIASPIMFLDANELAVRQLAGTCVPGLALWSLRTIGIYSFSCAIRLS
jgi:hypothetical protein